jgi:hypothetical protein
MSKSFIVLRMDLAGSDEAYQTLGPWTSGYATLEEADAHCRAMKGRYPRAKFAVFQRRVVYDSFIGTKRSLDRRSGQRDSSTFKWPAKRERATG